MALQVSRRVIDFLEYWAGYFFFISVFLSINLNLFLFRFNEINDNINAIKTFFYPLFPFSF